MVNIMKVVVIAAIAAAFSSGCSTSMVATETQLDRKAMTAALEPQDVRRTVEKMVDSMLADQEFIAEIGINALFGISLFNDTVNLRLLNLSIGHGNRHSWLSIWCQCQ